jgi:hypothetical protein
MQQLPQIKAAYDWFFAHWQAEATRAAASGDIATLTRLDERRDSLERGIFVLMFGQFEVAVTDVFTRARDSRAGNPDWTQRRGWDADALQGRKVPFETKLAFVLDRRAPAYGRILATYALRNHCAHGGTTTPVGSIDALEADLYAWQSQLHA